MSNTIKIPSLEDISMELSPVLILLNEIKAKVNQQPQQKTLYRNKDLKEKFGLSDNTITSYRDRNILPFTKIGDIFYYPVNEIDLILDHNSNYDYFKSKLR
jgi:hypothetical protein